jgi:hypothetical protein
MSNCGVCDVAEASEKKSENMIESPGFSRPGFLFSTGLASVHLLGQTPGQTPPRILLRSSWQVFNIGDIAHTPGVLTLLEKYLPEADVRLWASPDLSDEVAAMEHRRFPRLQSSKAVLGKTAKPRIQLCN